MAKIFTILIVVIGYTLAGGIGALVGAGLALVAKILRCPFL
jgi:hypothetical protein